MWTQAGRARIVVGGLVGIALSGRAVAAPAAAIHELPVTPLHIDLEVAGQRIGGIDYFRVVAATSTLTGTLNTAIADSAGALGVLATVDTAHPDDTMRVVCDVGIATHGFVSWRCVRFSDRGPDSDGSVAVVRTFAYYIDGASDGGRLREATLASQLTPRPDLARKLAGLEGSREYTTSFGGGSEVCHVENDAATPFLTRTGIQFQTEYGTRQCTVSWDALAPLLAPDSAANRLAADLPDEVHPRPSLSWNKAAPRFVAQPAPDDAVLDKVTGLVWSARDNGADITWPAAIAYARAYRGGGYTDWRLPTEAELEALAEPEMAHRERADCTKGKLDVLVTALLHPSCSLLWSSTPISGERAVAFGLASGTSRIARRSDASNHRALVVRDPGAATNDSRRRGATPPVGSPPAPARSRPAAPQP